MDGLKLRRLFLIAALLSAAAANLWSCGVADWIIGGNIDVNGARATIGQERASVGNNTTGYVFFGTQNRFRSVDIVSLLSGGQTCGGTTVLPHDSEEKDRCVEWAFECFDNYRPGQCPPLPGEQPSTTSTPQIVLFPPSDNPYSLAETQRMRRNAVQERLIAASNSACREFTQHLNTYQSYSNLILGTAAVGTGAAGAIVSTAVAARALSGVTSALAGTRAEYNSDLFAKQLVSTIVQAIDKSRQEYLVKLRGTGVEGAAVQPQPAVTPTATQSPIPVVTPKQTAVPTPLPTPSSVLGKQSLPIWQYSVEAAIADAIYYNDLCSLDKGLQTLTQSLTTAGNPGLDEFYEEVQKYKQINSAMPTAPAPTPTAP